MRRQIKKTVLPTVILVILMISQTVSAAPLHTTAASGPVSQFVYDNFDDNITDSSLWGIEQLGGPTVSEVNQRLEITLPANSTGTPEFKAWYLSACQLRGDYTIQVDYELLTWPDANGVRIGLADDHANMQRISSRGQPYDIAGGPDLFLTTFDVASHTVGITPTSDLSGKLRLERAGDTLSSYYFTNGAWTLDASYSDPAYAQDTYFYIGSFSGDPAFAGQEVKIAFDNMIINAGELVCPSNNVATGQIMPFSGTCAQFAAGTAANLDEAIYQLLPYQIPANKSNRVYTISPWDFYYYSKVIAPAESFQIKVSQFNTSGWPNLYNSLWDSRVYDANCGRVTTLRPRSSMTTSIPFKVIDATPGAVYIIGVHFQTYSLMSRPVTSPYPSMTYTFTTAVNDTLIDTGTDSILIRYQP